MLAIHLLLACSAPPTTDQLLDSTTEETPPVYLSMQWDPVAPAVPCPSDPNASLMQAALKDAGLSHGDLVYDDPWSLTSRVRDRLQLDWSLQIQRDPFGVPCHADDLARGLDFAMQGDHPVASVLGLATDRLEVEPAAAPVLTLSTDVDLSSIPPDLARALVPIIEAIATAAEVRWELETYAPESPADLVRYGNGHAGWGVDEVVPNVWSESVQRWIREDVPLLFEPARVLAFAIEEADLGRFEGSDVSFEAETAFGRILIAGPGRDAPGDLGRVALYLDLGGDDSYTHPTGANSASVPVAVHVDLGGNDTYGYETTDEGGDGLLPADSAGRRTPPFTPLSESTVGRQGSGRFGVGMSFDLGGGDDTYATLRMGQGWGALGVGVLYDDGGDDTYLAEIAAQGAASFGIGLFLDQDGHDIHRTLSESQGLGRAFGVGVAWDGGGDDEWFAEPGSRMGGPDLLVGTTYQLTDANNSVAQGVGFGTNLEESLSGGLGILRDRAGDDVYTAGMFAQGLGYGVGTGLLLDGQGADTYDALWHAQGSSAHRGLGVLLDAGSEDDRFNTRLAPAIHGLGLGHDLSIGLTINEGGNDTYVLPDLGAAASSCQGRGLFVDGGGDDTYVASTTRSVGYGNHWRDELTKLTSCDESPRIEEQSVGLFIDAGGTDTWTWPGKGGPGDDSTFGTSGHGMQGEHGGAVDGQGEAGLHATAP
ncbi:MAG: hypothetical protein KTR31_29410 [Myxococcales bacterium]|nr:hypothetical protein [Myxococcales bacterium]